FAFATPEAQQLTRRSCDRPIFQIEIFFRAAQHHLDCPCGRAEYRPPVSQRALRRSSTHPPESRESPPRRFFSVLYTPLKVRRCDAPGKAGPTRVTKNKGSQSPRSVDWR